MTEEENRISFNANKHIRRITDEFSLLYPASYNNINSYDDFLDNGIKEALSRYFWEYDITKKNEPQRTRLVKFDPNSLIIDRPRKYGDIEYLCSKEASYLYPTEAVVQKYSYSSMMCADLIFVNLDENKDEIPETMRLIKNIRITEIPLIVGCVRCNIKGLGDKDKRNVGFCSDDPGGYYIIDGTEYASIAQEKGSFNKIKIRYSDKFRAEFISLSGEDTRGLSVFIKKHGSYNVVKIAFATKSDGNGSKNMIFLYYIVAINEFLDIIESSVDIEKWAENIDITPKDINTLKLWKKNIDSLDNNIEWLELERMTMEHAKNIFYNSIIERGELSIKQGEEFSPLEESFVATYIMETMNHIDTIEHNTKQLYNNMALELVEFYKNNKDISTKMNTNIMKARYLRDGLDNAFFPHVENTTMFSDDEIQSIKRRILSDMVIQVSKAIKKYIEPDDQDDYRNRRLETAGILMKSLFSKSFKKYWRIVGKDAEKYFKGDPTNKDTETIIRKMMSTSGDNNIKKSIEKAIKQGKWGLVQNKDVRQNVTHILTRISKAAVISDLTKISIPDDENNKRTKPREVHISQFGLICPSKTPEGSRCGLTRYFAEQAIVTSKDTEYQVLSVLMPPNDKNWFLIEKDDPNIGLTSLKDPRGNNIDGEIWLNNKAIGYCNVLAISNLIRFKKTHNQLDHTISIIVKRIKDAMDDKLIISIRTDEGRVTSPVFVVRNGRLLEEQEQNKRGKWILVPEGKKSRFEDKSVPISSYIANGGIEYLDAIERGVDNLYWNEDLKEWFPIIIATSYFKLRGSTSIDPETEKETIEVYYTHCMIDPALIFNPVVSLIPFTSHIMAPRVTYFSNMGQQAMGIPMESMLVRPDTDLKVAAYSQKPIVTTAVYKRIGLDKSPAGMNVRVAIMSYGFNQEDAIIINKKSLDLGLFSNYTYKIYTAKLSSEREIKDMTEDEISILGDRYLKGIIRKYEVVSKGDVLAQKVWNTKTKGRSEAITLTDSRNGIVDRIFKQQAVSNNTSYKIRIRFPQVPTIGDKLTSRYAQKGVIGAIMDDIDMPFDEDGNTPDLIVNPAMLPRRMTLSQLFEMLIGNVKSSRDLSRRIKVIKEDFYIRIEEGVKGPDGIFREFWSFQYIRTSSTLSSISIKPSYMSEVHKIEPTQWIISFPNTDAIFMEKNTIMYVIIEKSDVRYIISNPFDVYKMFSGNGNWNMFPSATTEQRNSSFPKNKMEITVLIENMVQYEDSPIYKTNIVFGRHIKLNSGIDFDKFVELKPEQVVFKNPETENEFSEYVIKASSLKNNLDVPILLKRTGYKNLYDIIKEAWKDRVVPIRHIIGPRKQELEKRSELIEEQTYMDPFKKPNMKLIQKELGERGWNSMGETVLRRGDTGEIIKSTIFTGYVYYVALKHLVGEKIQARDRGALDPVSKQPIKGKQRDGGLRFGDMEVAALVAHGAAEFVNEKLKFASDETKAYFCNSCGNECYFKVDEQQYRCERGCEISSSDIAKVSIPYSLKYVRQYMGVAGLGIRMEKFGKVRDPKVKLKKHFQEQERRNDRIIENRTRVVVEQICEPIIEEDILDCF